MARSRKDAVAGGVAGAVLIVQALCLPASGQEAPAPPPFSQECVKGGEALVAVEAGGVGGHGASPTSPSSAARSRRSARR